MWDLVGNPEDRFSHNEAQLFVFLLYLQRFRQTKRVNAWYQNLYRTRVVILILYLYSAPKTIPSFFILTSAIQNLKVSCGPVVSFYFTKVLLKDVLCSNSVDIDQTSRRLISGIAYVIPWPLLVNQGFYIPTCLYSRVDFKNGSCHFFF